MRRKHIRLDYDPEVDAAYLMLSAGKVVASEEVQPGVIVDYDADERLLGVEILRFSRRFRAKEQLRPTDGKPAKTARTA